MGCALSTSSVRTRFSGKEVSSEDTPNAASDLERLCKETLVGEIVQRGTASYAAAVASARSANNCAVCSHTTSAGARADVSRGCERGDAVCRRG